MDKINTSKCSTCAVEIDKQLTISYNVVFGGNGIVELSLLLLFGYHQGFVALLFFPIYGTPDMQK